MAGAEDVARDKSGTGDEADEGGEAPGVVDLYGLAEQHAGGSDALRSIVAEARALAVSGRSYAVGGPKISRDSVRAYGTDVYRVTFRGDTEAAVTLTGDGDTDLDLHVYDENGNRVCRDIGPTDDAYCEWLPRWTGAFRIEVENLGGVDNVYRLATN